MTVQPAAPQPAEGGPIVELNLMRLSRVHDEPGFLRYEKAETLRRVQEHGVSVPQGLRPFMHRPVRPAACVRVPHAPGGEDCSFYCVQTAAVNCSAKIPVNGTIKLH